VLRWPCLLVCLFSVDVLAVTDAELRQLLDQMAHSVGQDSLRSAGSGHRFRLAHDRSFPCQVTVEERYTQAANRWFRRYRFSFETIKPGSHFMARDQRRAIVFQSRVHYTDGERRVFSEKRINNFFMPIHEAGQEAGIQALIDAVIAECRERNEF